MLFGAALGVTKIKLGRKLLRNVSIIQHSLNALLSWLSEQTVCRVFWTITGMCVEYNESNNNEIISSAEKVVRPWPDQPDRRLRPWNDHNTQYSESINVCTWMHTDYSISQNRLNCAMYSICTSLSILAIVSTD